MELLFAGLAGLLLGAIAGFVAKRRDLVGWALPAAVGGIVALVVWELLTWLGSITFLGWLRYDQGWIWWITLILAGLIAFLVANSLGTGRAVRDADLLDRLSKVGRTKKRRTSTSATAAKTREEQAEREVAEAAGDDVHADDRPLAGDADVVETGEIADDVSADAALADAVEVDAVQAEVRKP